MLTLYNVASLILSTHFSDAKLVIPRKPVCGAGDRFISQWLVDPLSDLLPFVNLHQLYTTVTVRHISIVW